MDIHVALDRAMRLHRGGQLDEAEPIYREILAVAPRDADALHYLGVLLHQRGASTAAIELIRRAIEAAPAYADAYNNLGNVLQEVSRFEDAADAYRRAFALRPEDPSTLNNLGIALRALGRVEEAIVEHRRAIERAPGFVEAHFSLGNALRAAGDLEGAIQAFGKTIELEPTHARAHTALGSALHRADRGADAAALFARWVAQDPGNPVARHLLAAASGADVPARASDGYVQHLFDVLARSFDEHLRQLHYRAPELALAALAADAGPPPQRLDVLDAGCGTGLCGPLLRPYARRLVGVDLSPRMLAEARRRAVYDELVTAELTAYLAASRDTFDVIVSADTLVYFGDLGPILAAAAVALRAGGRLVVTVERADEEAPSPAGYQLETSGRYRHTAPYVRRELAAAGLTDIAITAAVLRQEGGAPVAGWVAMARRAAAA